MTDVSATPLAEVPPPPGRYLVTGAAGFIGTHLLRRLHTAGCEVVALDVRPPDVIPSGVRYLECDLTNRAEVERVVSAHPSDYGVHLAARVGDWGTFSEFDSINVTGARNVLRALAQAKVRRAVHTSSIAAMGLDAGAVADESVAPVTTGDPYSATKALGELVARELQSEGAPVVIVRPGDVYGVGSTPWVVRPVELMRKRQMVLVEGGRGHFAHVHVENLIDAMLLALASERSSGETFLVTDGDTHCTIGEYFTRLAEAAGVPAPKVSVPRAAAKALGYASELGARLTGRPPPFTRVAVDFLLRKGSFRTDKARALLGWAPRVDLDEGLARIAAHYRRA